LLDIELSKMQEDLLEGTCRCYKQTFADFILHLKKIRVWPLHKCCCHASIDEMTDRLGEFSFQASQSSCLHCFKDYALLMDCATEKVDNAFDGLCIDCMDRTKSKTRDEDSDYVHHNRKNITAKYAHKCRINHGEMTWWYSFMGRRAKKNLMV
jgi:hypothetical protein